MITVVRARGAATPERLPSGAEWYSGAGDRYVMPSRSWNTLATKSMSGSCSPGVTSGSGRRMPFGRPVVPDE